MSIGLIQIAAFLHFRVWVQLLLFLTMFLARLQPQQQQQQQKQQKSIYST